MSANQELFRNLQQTFAVGETRLIVLNDFSKTFERVGTSHAAELAFKVMDQVIRSETIEQAEDEVCQLFSNKHYAKNGQTVFSLVQKGLQERLKTIFHEISPFLKDASTAIDYGCGTGELAQMIRDKLGIPIQGVDIRDFRADGVLIPFKKITDYHVDAPDHYYSCGVAIHVLHHDSDNEKIIKELSRIVSRKLIIIETVPEADNEEEAEKDWGRMFWNDVLWNRFFNYANIPVPGTYEMLNTWINRIEKYGWENTRSEDLGFDISTIQDRHHLLVFER